MVVVIIAILLSMIYMSFSKIQEDVKATKMAANLKCLEIALESYAATYGKYPNELYEVVSYGNSILREIPIDEFNPKENLSYALSPNKEIFAVWSAGKNRIKGVLNAWVGRMPVPSDDDDIGVTNGSPPNANWR